MKRFFTIIALGLMIASCSAEKDAETCSCTGRFKTFERINEPNYFYAPKTQIDCETGQPLKLPQPNAVFFGCDNSKQ